MLVMDPRPSSLRCLLSLLVEDAPPAVRARIAMLVVDAMTILAVVAVVMLALLLSYTGMLGITEPARGPAPHSIEIGTPRIDVR